MNRQNRKVKALGEKFEAFSVVGVWVIRDHDLDAVGTGFTGEPERIFEAQREKRTRAHAHVAHVIHRRNGAETDSYKKVTCRPSLGTTKQQETSLVTGKEAG